MSDERILEDIVGVEPPKSVDVFFKALLTSESLKKADSKDKVEHHSVFMNTISRNKKGSFVLVGDHVYKKTSKGWRTTKNLTTVEIVDSNELVDRYLDYMNSI